MIDLIPPQYRLLASIIALAVAMACAAAGGWLVNGWRLEGAHQKAIAAKQAEYDALATKVREQNHAVDILRQNTEAADTRRKQAEKFAADALKRINSRSGDVANSQAPDCDGVLREAWGNWK